jgi:hypothetical protein
MRNEVKIFHGMCVLSCTYSYVACVWVTVQYVLLLSHCIIVICFMSFALCYVLINCFMFFNYSFYVCCLVLYDLLCVFYVLCFCIFSPHVYSCLFSICAQLY